MSTSVPKLSDDLLYLIAEQMLFTKPHKNFNRDFFFKHEVDLRRENVYTEFMQLTASTMKIFFAHFTKMKAFEFSNDIKLFRNANQRSWANSKDDAFTGPFLVSKEFVQKLVSLRRLSLTSVTVYPEYLMTAEDVEQNNKPISCKFPIQNFSKLFLDQDLSDNDAANFPFELNELKIHCVTNGLSPKFKDFLNLNAKEIEVTINEINFPDFSVPICASTANRVNKFAITSSCLFDNSRDIPFDAKLMNWYNLLHSLLISCPQIQTIDHFAEMVNEFVDKIFPSLPEGNANAQISVLLELNCDTDAYQDLSLETNDLFRRGVQVSVELQEQSEEYTARECRVVDLKGREHKCVFQVLAKEASYGSDVIADVLSFQSNDDPPSNDGYDDYGYEQEDDSPYYYEYDQSQQGYFLQ